jgi:caffeoyl-CoA O-methyltransferase
VIPIVDEAIEHYAATHSARVDALYEDLRVETMANVPEPQMQVGRLEGRLLKLLTQLAEARLAVEIGTYTGYSGLSIAEGLPDDGHLITFDKDPMATEVARRYFARAPWGHKIELRLGDARERVSEVAGPIDFAFIDADKTGYRHYWDTLVPRMRSGGIIAVDNVLWSGHVLAPREGEASDRALVTFNTHVAADERVEAVMLTVRDGLFVARVK